MKKQAVPTIQDVAREAGVSASTVSNVLNRRWKQTSKETRERILEIAARLNYQPNAMAAALRRRSSRTIGVVVTDILNPFYTAIVRAIQDEARRAGYQVILANSDDDPAQEKEALNTVKSKQVDGMIIVTTGGNHEAIKQARDSGLPIVLVDRDDPNLGLDTVHVDNMLAAENATRYLLDLGHRKVAIVGGPISGVPTRAGRYNGYVKALRDAGIETRPEYQAIVRGSIDNGRRVTADLLRLADPPTAILATNAFLAIGAMQAIHDRGLSIPRDISFAMFDDPIWATLCKPPITTVSQPTEEIGARAFQLIEGRLKKRRSADPQAVIMPTSLIIRGSCAPPQERRSG
ncbi:MAG: LacI family DNA-binding transcriptional regulator [Bryobacteraceae bacterium]